MTDLLEVARAIMRPWVEPLGLDDVQIAMLTEEIHASLFAERQRWMDCAMVDATMEGPKLKGWNRSALDRLWRGASR
jgi:hypothetical protein